MSLRTYFQTYQFPVLFTRAANVYGPGQQLYRIIPRTIVAAMGGQKLRLDGGGKSVRVFIHMNDVSDATLKIAREGRRWARPTTSPATSWSRSASWSR
jgi:dTDP-glucose 4,6-dehydratase